MSQTERKSIARGVASLFRTLAVGAFLCISLSACVFIQSSTIGESTGSGSAVAAADSGLLTDVQTQLSMRDWFLIVQYYTVAASAICKPPPPPPPPPPAPVEKIVLRGVHFDFNKYNIRPGDAAVLNEAAATLKGHPNMVVNVNGYCDAIGSAEYNLKLSEKRAEAVVDYLEKDGIPADRLVPHGYGKTNFVATNSTREGRAQNRRVELVPAE
jgi:outer membrane protein OmpA-like peptidoglycan-associated protein